MKSLWEMDVWIERTATKEVGCKGRDALELSMYREETENSATEEGVAHGKVAEGDKCWDVVIIGAGITGVLTAYFLQKEGKRVLVLDSGEIAGGQTGRTTAKITSQHGLIYSKLIANVGVEAATLYAEANQRAIGLYEKLIEELKIDCDFVKLPSYVYSTRNREVLLQEAAAARKLGLPAYFTEDAGLPFEIVGAVCFEQQAQFHPLKFVNAIASRLKICQYARVKKVRGNTVYTTRGTFSGKKIVFATHYPIVDIPGFYFLRQHQERSYVVALQGCNHLDAMYFSEDENGVSLRSHGEILLVGGSSHRTGKNEAGGAYDTLRRVAKEYFPEGKEIAHWSAQDCMPHDGLPFIGQYFYGCRDWYVATGFQKWGMSTAMVAARLLTDELLERNNPYAKLFSPQRHHIRAAAANFLKDAWESIHGLCAGRISLKKAEDKPPRCSHLGCQLKWNPDEGTWDCPCHGSRFDRSGAPLDEPAAEAFRCRARKD